MRDSAATLRKVITGNEPVAIVLARDSTARGELIEFLNVLMPAGEEPFLTSDAAELFDRATFDKVVLITPVDESAALSLFERRRDELVDRTRPGILFLLRDGEAMKLLPRFAAIASWLRGRSETIPARTPGI